MVADLVRRGGAIESPTRSTLPHSLIHSISKFIAGIAVDWLLPEEVQSEDFDGRE